MKISLGELRRLIRETIEESMGLNTENISRITPQGSGRARRYVNENVKSREEMKEIVSLNRWRINILNDLMKKEIPEALNAINRDLTSKNPLSERTCEKILSVLADYKTVDKKGLWDGSSSVNFLRQIASSFNLDMNSYEESGESFDPVIGKFHGMLKNQFNKWDESEMDPKPSMQPHTRFSSQIQNLSSFIGKLKEKLQDENEMYKIHHGIWPADW